VWGKEEGAMQRIRTLMIGVAGALLIAVLCPGEGAAHGREPLTWTRCICVDGVPLEIVESSLFERPGQGRLDWPGADAVVRCRPEPLPVGAPGEKAPSVAKW
jgi:hypothetical protein